MMEAVQPQQAQPLFQPEVQEFRTPEEIMITVLAQTIILSLMQQMVATHSFEMTAQEKPQENAKEGEKSKEGEAPKESLKFAEKESVRSTSKMSSTPNQRAQQKGESLKPHEMMSRVLQQKVLSKMEARSESTQLGRQAALPDSPQAATIAKPLMPAPQQDGRAMRDHSQKAEEHGTPRRAMPQGPKENSHTSDSIFQHKVDKDSEEQPHKKRNFCRGKGKVKATNKVERVAKRHFTPPAKSDYEHFLRIMMQDSELSEFFGTRISHFDVMLLFIELMKLEVEDNHQERIARLDERRYQIEAMEKVVKQYKSQAKFLLFAGVGAGALGLLSGALPIAGHLGGDSILAVLRRVTGSFNDMKRTKAFDNLSKMFFSMSEMNKAMGQVQSSFCEGERSWAEHTSSLHRTDGEESTRTIEERTREFKNWNDILAQFLRMEQELVRQLYG